MVWSIRLTACLLLAAGLSLVPSARAGEPTAATEDLDKLPKLVLDESATDWAVDRFAGNSTAGPEFFQGPAREVGGLGRPYGVAPLPDGRVYIASGGNVLEVDKEGTLRLVIGGGGSAVEGPPDQVSGGKPVYNPHDKMLYLTGPNCLRRVVEKEDGSWHIEVVAGTPGKSGFDDGPVKDATFKNLYNVVINSRGEIYILDDGRRFCRIKSGEVKTLHPNFRGGKRVDGPLDQASFNIIGLGGGICLGEDDDTIYVADHWNFCARKIDLKNGIVTTVAGMPKPKEWKKEKQTPREKRYNSNADGPALTHASFNSGCGYACYDPVHGGLYVGGPDESRFRWVKDGWVRTVIGRKVSGSGGGQRWPCNALGVDGKVVHLTWNSVVAVDHLGRAYLAASSHKHGLWRAYNRKEATK